jgi:guanine deaminase
VYAATTARHFVEQLLAHGTTTALVFASHFHDATVSLFDAARVRGLRLATGLILSDRALQRSLHLEPGRAHAACTTLIERFHRRGRLLYAVTPRFALSTSEAMFEVCQSLVREHADLITQTHINEQPEEVDACLRAFPWAADYLGIYERYDLVGPRTVLAHSVQTTDAELQRMAAARATVSHCPCSNAALGSGIFPMARHQTAGVRIALGTDVGGGTGFGLLKESLQSYLLQRVAPSPLTLTPEYLLYLATRAGALALGLDEDAGDLQPGRSADLVYIRPAEGTPLSLVLERAQSMTDALAAIITMGDASAIEQVLVGGDVVSRRAPAP